MIVEEDRYLEHFGILGMKWGVRRDLDKQGRREARAQKYEAKAAGYQSTINILDTKMSEIHGFSLNKKLLSRQKSHLQGEIEQALTDAERKRQGKLSINQRRVVIGAAAVGTALAVWGAQASLQSGQARRLVEMGKRFVTRQKSSPWKQAPSLANPNLDADGLWKKVVSGINPDYGKIGTKQNCRRATFAYEMRRRGHDVQATRTTNARGQHAGGLFNAISPEGTNLVPSGMTFTKKRWTREQKKVETNRLADAPFFRAAGRMNAGSGFSPIRTTDTDQGTVSNIFEVLSRQPDRSRGEVGIVWNSGGGHSLAYEIVNNRPVIFDTQNGKRFLSAIDFDGQKYPKGIRRASFTRLDNLELNQNFLLRWLRNAD